MASAEQIHNNRLAGEKSPYLLQHAHNPVEWYPWGEEAFKKARLESKPIFLSIGYSTCHWCHVMERESFEDPATAALMNEHFVSIKVDREERPDLDSLYMQAVMQMTGQGGWPMSVFLTPDREPFYGGTYFPPENRWGHPGFKSLLNGIAEAWKNRREEVWKSGREMVVALQTQAQAAAAASGEPPSEKILAEAFRHFSEAHDETYGGFLPAPKFPRSHALSLILRYWKRSGDPRALKIAEKTLQAMAAGGIYDHLGGGFHRYSTDAQWHVPHFEKMLYDQALLARTYLEVVQATGSEEYARPAREIFEYVLREMTGPEGGFYSAEDADSAELENEVPGTETVPGTPVLKKEGAFYVWTAKEIQQLLGSGDGELFNFLYGVQLHGNVAGDPMGEFGGKNILFRAHSAREAGAKFRRPEKEIEETEARCRRKLFEARVRRPRPHLDDKVLVDWNGLMISSLAFGSRVLDEPRYAEAARRAASFVLKKMVRADGRLLHRYRAGESGIPGHLEDYAFLIHGLVDLYEATFDPRFLAEANRLTGEMVRLFWDDERGGFFMTGTDAEKLLVRQKEIYDGAVPSGNSVAALDLIRVGRLTSQQNLEEKAGRLMKEFSGLLRAQPTAFPQMLIALDFALGPSSEIAIAGPPEDPATRRMLREVYRPFLPDKVVALHPPGEAGRAAESLIPFLKERTMREGKPAAYICRNYACKLPTTDVEKLKELLIE